MARNIMLLPYTIFIKYVVVYFCVLTFRQYTNWCKNESNGKGKVPCVLQYLLSVSNSTQNMFPSIKVVSVQIKFIP